MFMNPFKLLNRFKKIGRLLNRFMIVQKNWETFEPVHNHEPVQRLFKVYEPVHIFEPVQKVV